MVCSVLPAYSTETAEPPHSSPLESSSQILGGRRSPAVACWASDHWVASSNPLRGKFRHSFRLIIPGVCLAQFSLNNVHKRGLKHHHFISFPARFYTVPRVRPGCHPGHDTNCSGYKHFILIYEKTSLPLSVRGAYKATTAPYLNIWCLQYFPLIQRRQRNRHTPLP